MTVTPLRISPPSGPPSGQPAPDQAAEDLELILGDPYDDASPYGFAAAVGRDERDEFPSGLCDALRATGFHRDYLPAGLGGTFRSFDRSLTLVRTAARRDLNVMPGTMFSITAATCLALHGSDGQRRRAAEILRRGGTIGFALSEAGHGSDLLANTARLEPDARGNGLRLTGTKWMVGLGRRCEAVYVVARTGDRGPAAFTAVLLDLTGEQGLGFERGPEVRTGGMRGIDFCDLSFDRYAVPADAVVGREGEALEAAVRAQQVVRVMSMAGSLGCADTALRLTLDFAAGRNVGRTRLLDAAYPRRELAAASAALLAADAVALAAARGLHVAPGTFSVWGCAAKHVVAEATEDLMARCSTVLATRSLLRGGGPGGGPGGGLFQKLRRDAAVVRVVDTSTVANLRSFAGQLPALAAAAGSGADEDALRTVFALDAPLPPFDPAGLDLNARGRDLATAGLASVAGQAVRALAARGDATTAGLVGRLDSTVAALADEVPGRGGNELVDLAERFAYLQAAACCVHLWWANRQVSLFGTDPGTDPGTDSGSDPGAQPGSSGWLGAALGYLLARADGTDPRRTAAGPLTPALDAVSGLHRANRLFSAVPVRLTGPDHH